MLRLPRNVVGGVSDAIGGGLRPLLSYLIHMPCYNPLQAARTVDGKIVFKGSYNHHKVDTVQDLQLPCGQCIGCRLKRSRMWATRCVHEASLYEHNCFITLTYSDEHKPDDDSLHYSHFQDFLKRLRKHHKGLSYVSNPNPNSKTPFNSYPIRFYMCGEYGELFERPHFHALLFNFDFLDKQLFFVSPSGSKVFRSSQLEQLWPFGHSSIGEVNFESAAYVARYCTKKITGDNSFKHYNSVDVDGVISTKTSEFNKMSLKPGIGSGWFDKYSSDVFPSDEVILNGRKLEVPRYYDKLLERLDPFDLDDVKFSRYLDGKSRASDNTPERLAVKEKVQLSRFKELKRKIA